MNLFTALVVLKSAIISLPNPETHVSELTLTFQESKAVSGNCPLTLKRFEYFESIHTLSVALEPAPICAKEDFGQREGIVKWNLPENLFSSADLRIILNDRDLGIIQIANGQIIVKTKP